MKMLSKKNMLVLLLASLVSTQSSPFGLSWFAPAYDMTALFFKNTLTATKEYPRVTTTFVGLSLFSTLCALISYKYRKQTNEVQQHIDAQKRLQVEYATIKAKAKQDLQATYNEINDTLDSIEPKKAELLSVKAKVETLKANQKQEQEKATSFAWHIQEQKRLTQEIALLETHTHKAQLTLESLKESTSKTIGNVRKLLAKSHAAHSND